MEHSCDDCINKCPKGYIPIRRTEYNYYEMYKNEFISVNSKKGKPWAKYKYILGFFEFLKRTDEMYITAQEDMYNHYMTDEQRESYYEVMKNTEVINAKIKNATPEMLHVIDKVLNGVTEEQAEMIDVILGD